MVSQPYYVVLDPQEGAHDPMARPLAEARFVTAATLAAMPQFPPDSARLPVRPNTLMEHALVGYYRQGWSKWYD